MFKNNLIAEKIGVGMKEQMRGNKGSILAGLLITVGAVAFIFKEALPYLANNPHSYDNELLKSIDDDSITIDKYYDEQ